MNLFQSEEHIRNWQQFDPAKAGGIISLRDLVTLFSGPLFRKRQEPDYVSQCPNYVKEFLAALSAMGPFWKPEG